ncbi:alpha/beta hydrolase [Microbacterium sp. AZCO]|uniref:alpha/beta fold hydrolase n=1 Tax=Microbacterium sp. AZCO TaxID=3142976 RepID=UPI0031F3E242
MDIILVPGLWLDSTSWEAITPALEAAGHAVHPLTMPGLGVPAPAADAIGIGEWVDAVVAEIDAAEGPVALVGHSGGGNVVWGAADARPDRVARVVFVDTVPPPPGRGISEFDVVDGVVPFPGWDFFDAPDVFDLDAATREHWAARTRSVPGRVPTDPLAIGDERRHAIPVTVLSGGADEEELRAQLAEWGPWAEEFESIQDAEVVKLGTGHWPQFSKPDELARAIEAAVRR